MDCTRVLLLFGLLLIINGQSDDWRSNLDDLWGPAGAKSSPKTIVPVSNTLLEGRETTAKLSIPIESPLGVTDEATSVLLGGSDNDERRNIVVSIDGRAVESDILRSEPTLDQKTKSSLGGSVATGGVPVFNPTLYEKRDALRDVLDTVNDVVSAKREHISSAIDSGPQPIDNIISDELDRQADVNDRRLDAMDSILSERIDRRTDLVDEVVDKLGDATDNLQDGISDIGKTASVSKLDLLESRQDVLSDISDNVLDTLSEISERRYEKLENRLDSLKNRQESARDIIDDVNDNLENVIDRVADLADSKRDKIENSADIKNDYVDHLRERVDDRLERVAESRDEQMDNMVDGNEERIDRRKDLIEDRADKNDDILNIYGDLYDERSDWLKETVEREMERHEDIKIDAIDIKDSLDFWDQHLHSNGEGKLNSKSILNLAYRMGGNAKRRTKSGINMRIPKIGRFSKSKSIPKTVSPPVNFNKYNWYPNRYAIYTKSSKNPSPVRKSMNKGLRISIKSKDDDDDSKSMKIEIKTKVDGKREDNRDGTASHNRWNSFRRRTRPLSQSNRRGDLSRRRGLYSNPRPSFRPPFTQRTDVRRPPYGMRSRLDFRPRLGGLPYPRRGYIRPPPPFGRPFPPVPRAMPFGPPMIPF